LTQQRHDLFRTVSLLHLESFPALRAGRILSYSLDQVSGRAPPSKNKEASRRDPSTIPRDGSDLMLL
jgi:hypothetical protein